MPRQASVNIANNFTKGLVTQASGLNFPENACVETYDCYFNLDGSVERRRGFDFEYGYQTKAIDRTQSAISTYLWNNASGDGSVTLFMMQIGNTLYGYTVDSGTISATPVSSTVNLTTFAPGGAPEAKNNECQFTDGLGYLYVTHPHLNPFYVSFDVTSRVFTATQIDIKIRDYEGVSDGLGVDERPSVTLGSISNTHLYNLYNQGWTTANLTAWDTARTDMPSNVDIMWRFKNASEVFDPTVAATVMDGNAAAAKGHFVLNVFDQQRDAASGVAGIADVNTTYKRPSTCSFYSGRMFYSGVQYPGFGSKVLYSRVLEQIGQVGQCYQDNDPTSETNFEMFTTDGGVINIPDAGNILKLWALENAMVVFGNRGIFAIAGSQGVGFGALDYSIRKIATMSIMSPTNFVDVGGYPCWWTSDSIYMLIPDPTTGNLTVKDIGKPLIQDFLNDIPLICKKQARGAFNAVTGNIYWLYRSTEASGVSQVYEYDRVLVYNVQREAFNPWTISAGVNIHAVVKSENIAGAISQDIVVNGVNTVVWGADDVISFNIGQNVVEPSFKFLVSYVSSGTTYFTFAEASSLLYLDWPTLGVNADYSSFFTSGYRLEGGGAAKGQTNYVYIYSRNDVPTQYYVQGVWNFARTGNSGHWGSRQKGVHTSLLYRNNYHRFKFRGSGVCVQVRVSSVTGHPFEMLGWSTYDTVNTKP